MGDTKNRILETALELFAQSGYLGTSMNDIAKQLGITKAALYKHYAGKQEILEQLVERMKAMNQERAQQFAMPDGELAQATERYAHMPKEKIQTYSRAQFLHWTEDRFCAQFRKMLTLEQYRDPTMEALYQEHLAAGPVAYMTEIFRGMTETEEEAKQAALAFYGPIYLLYSLYDSTDDKQPVLDMLDAHVECFIRQMEDRKGN